MSLGERPAIPRGSRGTTHPPVPSARARGIIPAPPIIRLETSFQAQSPLSLGHFHLQLFMFWEKGPSGGAALGQDPGKGWSCSREVWDGYLWKILLPEGSGALNRLPRAVGAPGAFGQHPQGHFGIFEVSVQHQELD